MRCLQLCNVIQNLITSSLWAMLRSACVVWILGTSYPALLLPGNSSCYTVLLSSWVQSIDKTRVGLPFMNHGPASCRTRMRTEIQSQEYSALSFGQSI